MGARSTGSPSTRRARNIGGRPWTAADRWPWWACISASSSSCTGSPGPRPPLPDPRRARLLGSADALPPAWPGMRRQDRHRRLRSRRGPARRGPGRRHPGLHRRPGSRASGCLAAALGPHRSSLAGAPVRLPRPARLPHGPGIHPPLRRRKLRIPLPCPLGPRRPRGNLPAGLPRRGHRGRSRPMELVLSQAAPGPAATKRSRCAPARVRCAMARPRSKRDGSHDPSPSIQRPCVAVSRKLRTPEPAQAGEGDSSRKIPFRAERVRGFFRFIGNVSVYLYSAGTSTSSPPCLRKALNMSLASFFWYFLSATAPM